MKKHETFSERRVRQFKRWLKEATGDRCLIYAAGRVLILRNQFSPERDFHSIQAAIDNFSHLMSEQDYRALNVKEAA